MNKLIPLLLFILPVLCFSAQITNNIQGVGPKGAIKPYICIQNGSGQVTLKLAPGKSGEANVAAGNAYYVGATIRFDGCGYENSYLGYVGFSLNNAGNNSVNHYSPPEGVHVTYANPSIDSHGNVGGVIAYTPIDANFNMTPALPARNWPFAGINLAGLEFGKVIEPFVIPNLSLTDSQATGSDLADTQAFINAGMNTVRVPISWGYLQLNGPVTPHVIPSAARDLQQKAGVGELNHAYYDNYLKPLLQTLTHAKVHTIVDLHAYMRYSKFGEQYSGCGFGPCPDGQLIVDEKAYQSVWGQLFDLMNNDPLIDKNYLMLDLMNEPVAVPNDSVFTIQASVIKLLRQKKFNGYIMVEGNNWSGLHSWATEEWAGDNGQTYSNATLFTRDNFAKAGITDLSKILINVHQYLDSDYSGTHDDCQQDLSSTGRNGFNLNAFVDYLTENQLQAIVTEFGTGRNASSCQAPLAQFMDYLHDNASKANGRSGFVGWTIWSTGHGWSDYNLRVKPTSYHMQVLSSYL
jgi:endoglucanase